MENQSMKYIMPLDGIDLACIAVYTKRDKKETIPLWSPPHSDDDTYFEFEVYQTSEIGETGTANLVQKSVLTEGTEDKLPLTTYITIITAILGKKPLPFKLKAIDESTLQINVNTYKRVFVPVDNFHGFVNVGEKTVCRVCRTMVGHREMHKLNERHIELVFSPITDNHCIRKIDHTWSHCILCNEIIDSKEFHINYSSTHELKFRDALLAYIDQMSKYASNDFPTGNIIKSEDQIIPTATNMYEHAENGRPVNLVYPNNYIQIPSFFQQPVNISSPNTQANMNIQTIYCDSCNISMPVSHRDIHLHSQSHNQSKVNEMMRRNTMYYAPQQVTYPQDIVRDLSKNTQEPQDTSINMLELRERIQKLVTSARENEKSGVMVMPDEKPYLTTYASVQIPSNIEEKSKDDKRMVNQVSNVTEDANCHEDKQSQAKKPEVISDVNEKIKKLITVKKNSKNVYVEEKYRETGVGATSAVNASQEKMPPFYKVNKAGSLTPVVVNRDVSPVLNVPNIIIDASEDSKNNNGTKIYSKNVPITPTKNMSKVVEEKNRSFSEDHIKSLGIIKDYIKNKLGTDSSLKSATANISNDHKIVAKANQNESDVAKPENENVASSYKLNRYRENATFGDSNEDYRRSFLLKLVKKQI